MRIKDIEENEKLTDFLYKDIEGDLKILDDVIIQCLFEVTEIIINKKDIE